MRQSSGCTGALGGAEVGGEIGAVVDALESEPASDIITQMPEVKAT